VITVQASDVHRLHHVSELHGAKLAPSAEAPERVDVVMAALIRAGHTNTVKAEAFGLGPVKRVHSPAYVDFLAGAHAEWVANLGVSEDSEAFPAVYPVPDTPERQLSDIRAKLGRFSFDVDPIGPNTWVAAAAASDVALTGQQLVADGTTGVFAVCRPPGHHVTVDRYGGYCYLNNAAIAAQAFVDGGARPAILDVDFHHGNGTQAVFYDRKDVLYISLHADPQSEYPYFFGYADESGSGEGEGYNLNLPLPAGTKWDKYSDALDTGLARITSFSPDVLVVSLGVDTAIEDPDSFGLLATDFLRIGEAIGALNRPTLFILEGGYELAVLGRNVASVLSGFETS
jgi:acetoin utilization deacetylase AcuC-like enzyme